MWREKLRTASFRGVQFHVDTSDDTAAGRRAVQHTYPGRDLPYTEDMGRRQREYRLDAYIVSPDYMAARDQLIDACQEAGPGDLVHPYFGTRRVVCTECRVTHSAADGGIVRFALAFVEAGELTYPRGTTDRAAAVDTAAGGLRAAAEAALIEGLDVSGMPRFVVDAAADVVGSLAGQFEQLAGPLPATPGALAEYAAAVLRLGNDAASLVGAPADLASAIGGAMDMLRSAFGDTASTLGSLTELAGFGEDLPAVPVTTATRQRQAANQAAIAGYVQDVALAVAAQSITAVEFETRDEALARRDAVLELVDGRMETTADDAVFTALQNLRAQVVQAVPGPGQQLPVLLEYRPESTLPALVVAYDIYGDAGMADDIVARNGVRHPGFVPGGQALEVIAGD